jgi:predicted nucleic acid-binding protein
MRAIVDGEPQARAWLTAIKAGAVQAVAPDLVHAEVANALRKYVPEHGLTPEGADERLALTLDLPLTIVPTRLLARQALALAVARGISAYDGLYLALALGFAATLVTADRRLAAAATGARVELLPPV